MLMICRQCCVVYGLDPDRACPVCGDRDRVQLKLTKGSGIPFMPYRDNSLAKKRPVTPSTAAPDAQQQRTDDLWRKFDGLFKRIGDMGTEASKLADGFFHAKRD